MPAISKVLIANRGEIALRVARTCREMGIASVVVHSAADRDSPEVAYAEGAVQTGPAAVHPGYGFLSEDPDFAEICESSGLTFIGPTPAVIARLGDKAQARRGALEGGLQVLPGSTQAIASAEEAARLADE